MNNKGQLNKLDTLETLKRNAKLNNVQNWTKKSKSESAEHNDVMLLQGKSIESHSIANPIRKKPKVFQEKTYFPSLDKKIQDLVRKPRSGKQHWWNGWKRN